MEKIYKIKLTFWNKNTFSKDNLDIHLKNIIKTVTTAARLSEITSLFKINRRLP